MVNARSFSTLALLSLAAALDNGVGLLPALGFSTWNRFLYGINASLIMEIADALVATGLRDSGFKYLNLDAGVWLHERDAAGDLQANPALFPGGLKPIAAYLNARGLRLGVYTDIGVGSCGPGPGSGGHWPQDARFFASLPAEYLKADFCGGPQNYDPASELAAWAEAAEALNATGWPMYFSICPKSNAPRNLTGPLTPYAGQTGLYFPPQAWTREQKRAVASAWLVEVRNNVDGWSPLTSSCKDVGAPCGMVTNIDSQVAFGKWEETGPGGLVDADILEVCQFSASCFPAFLLPPPSSRSPPAPLQTAPSTTPGCQRARAACTITSGPSCPRRSSSPLTRARCRSSPAAPSAWPW